MVLKDELNDKIIEYLKRDGRASYLQIAKDLNVSESTIRKRVKKLIDEKIIKKFTVIVNPTYNGKNIVAFLKIVPTQSNLVLNKLIKNIISLPEIEEAFYTSGKCGILAKVVVKNLDELDKLIDKIREIEGIYELESCIVLKELKSII